MPKDKIVLSYTPIAVPITEAALMIGICEKSMYALAASDGFPSVRLGKRILIPVDGLRTWINSQIGKQLDLFGGTE